MEFQGFKLIGVGKLRGRRQANQFETDFTLLLWNAQNSTRMSG